jgi:hypothetical protein
MAREVISITSTRSSRCGQSADRRSKSATSLISRLLNHSFAGRSNWEKPEAELARLASALLQCRIAWDRALGLNLALDPVWSMLLLVYVRQLNSPGVPIASLSNLPIAGPDTVILRWTIKLVDEGILELAEDRAGGAEPVVQLSPDALYKIEEWLRASKAEFGTFV